MPDTAPAKAGRRPVALAARGVALAVAAVLLLGAGFRFGYPELTMLGTAAAVGVVCAFGYAAWRPSLVITRVADPDRVARGDPCTVELRVRNTSRLRAATMIAQDRCGARTVPVPLLRLRAGKDTTLRYPVPTERRGVIGIGPLRVVRRDPLALVRVARSHGETIRVWVHPKVYPLAAVPAGVSRSLDGRIDTVPHGSITFATLREYVVGDELRRVHWRTSARVGELMVRESVDTSLPRIVVLLDDRAAAYGAAELFESACEAAASVIVAAVGEDLPVALYLVSGAAAGGGARSRSARAHLDLLAEATLGQPQGTDDALRTAAQRLRHTASGDTLLFLTGGPGGEELGPVGALRGRYASVVAGVFGRSAPRPAVTSTGMLVLDARDGADFAAEWDGVRAW